MGSFIICYTTRSLITLTVTKHYGIHVKTHFDALDQSWYAAYANLDLAVPGTPARNEPLPMAENDYRVPTFFVGMGLTAPFPPAFLVHLNQQQAIIQQQLTNAYQQLSRINGPLFPDAGNLPAGEFCVPIQRPIDMLSTVIRVDDFQKIPCHAFSSFVDEDKKSTWYPKTDLSRGSYGRTMLWVKTDENDRIQEVSIRKLGFGLTALLYGFKLLASQLLTEKESSYKRRQP